LIDRAIADLALDIERSGVVHLAGFGLFHLRNSRRGSSQRDRVGRPRHFIVFRVLGGELQILRLLHDAMDIPAQLGIDE
jgi:plasmid stabilization system protein ParE